ncbi:MAG: Uma2 family endonuclease [Cyanobacteria bacterium Co-bin8]|nr:Uma2 family endonuclease [Cyanobacteria bacterium Co-bin8]
MTQLSLKNPTDTWISATWEDYLEIPSNPTFEQAKGYYHEGYMRLEMSPIGNPHSRDHASIIGAIYLFAGLKNIDLDAHDNCTYRKVGFAVGR